MRDTRTELPWRGRRVTVMGLGRHGGGLAAVRYLAQSGARVTVTDCATAARLQATLAELADLPGVQVQLGEHQRRHFIDTDVIVVNPAVGPDNRHLAAAAAAGIPITSEIELFLQRCPARVVGVTGSCGKSTTAAMIAAISQRAGRRTWLGGNIEHSLLPDLPAIDQDDLVILELSSFQLQWLGPATRRPDVAVVTNCEPNHLDWHGSYGHYLAAKKKILDSRRSDQQLVTGDPLRAEPHRHHWPSHAQPPWPDSRIPPLQIAGVHNRRNACLAAAAAAAVGCEDQAVAGGLRAFRGLPHRLQPLGQVDHRHFINDSQATTPAATMAAVQSVGPRCWLLAGGADKGAPLDDLAGEIVRHCCGGAFFGATSDKLIRGVLRQAAEFHAVRVPTLAAALDWCWSRSAAGDTILLSPACSSLDQYADYAERADDFRRQITRLGQLSPQLPRQQVAAGLV
ncbi:MAG: UDP-N-acetylmuramoyl-L-alanine--D-glutamate ligase [Planctomycetales bacterium]|nr:UDP-N-acetylmuramoyl-L-alanine--D-glutamate ligase [Planctomycetales bacterium]NIM09389.1 UDP-N-acetylmuramoyl-L-alanine--D-glutamate ligase [Planctomycetales bacterium]NIN08859.1 UDP-N-acetylmuramoyl-L-alanine--D-glutamate ligase [Planctomycetales bacterium]NIN77976.1 UDP-N-acetylmuramoyl-L-alanine--D-glutamate ligase [Planctomycetales bacterium]NIO35159.1 UDP-N-acetylmuramoyl-L-alanine--D-glutamate ligase [Planctomycetales bacterium]